MCCCKVRLGHSRFGVLYKRTGAPATSCNRGSGVRTRIGRLCDGRSPRCSSDLGLFSAMRRGLAACRTRGLRLGSRSRFAPGKRLLVVGPPHLGASSGSMPCRVCYEGPALRPFRGDGRRPRRTARRPAPPGAAPGDGSLQEFFRWGPRGIDFIHVCTGASDPCQRGHLWPLTADPCSARPSR